MGKLRRQERGGLLDLDDPLAESDSEGSYDSEEEDGVHALSTLSEGDEEGSANSSEDEVDDDASSAEAGAEELADGASALDITTASPADVQDGSSGDLSFDTVLEDIEHATGHRVLDLADELAASLMAREVATSATAIRAPSSCRMQQPLEQAAVHDTLGNAGVQSGFIEEDTSSSPETPQLAGLAFGRTPPSQQLPAAWASTLPGPSTVDLPPSTGTSVPASSRVGQAMAWPPPAAGPTQMGLLAPYLAPQLSRAQALQGPVFRASPRQQQHQRQLQQQHAPVLQQPTPLPQDTELIDNPYAVLAALITGIDGEEDQQQEEELQEQPAAAATSRTSTTAPTAPTSGPPEATPVTSFPAPAPVLPAAPAPYRPPHHICTCNLPASPSPASSPASSCSGASTEWTAAAEPELAECWLCYEEGCVAGGPQDDDATDALLAPCRECRGGMRHLHRSCFQQWLSTSWSAACPNCKHLYERHVLEAFPDGRSILRLMAAACPASYPADGGAPSSCLELYTPYPYGSMLLFRIGGELDVSVMCEGMKPVELLKRVRMLVDEVVADPPARPDGTQLVLTSHQVSEVVLTRHDAYWDEYEDEEDDEWDEQVPAGVPAWLPAANRQNSFSGTNGRHHETAGAPHDNFLRLFPSAGLRLLGAGADIGIGGGAGELPLLRPEGYNYNYWQRPAGLLEFPRDRGAVRGTRTAQLQDRSAQRIVAQQQQRLAQRQQQQRAAQRQQQQQRANIVMARGSRRR